MKKVFVFLAGLLSVAMFLTGCGIKSKNNIEDTSKNVLINYNAYKKSTPTFSQITYFKIINSSAWLMNRNEIWHATTIQGTWHKVFHLQHPSLSPSVQFDPVTENIGWLLMPKSYTYPKQSQEKNILWITRDGGDIWTPLELPWEYPAILDFLNSKVGFISTYQRFPDTIQIPSANLYFTKTGGRSWTELTKAFPGQLWIKFITPTVGFTSSNWPDHKFYESENGGKTWNSIPLFSPKIPYFKNISSVDFPFPPHFFNDQVGILPVNVLCSSKQSRLYFFLTKNAGHSWNFIGRTPKLPISTKNIAFLSPTQWLIQNDLTLYTTHDAGSIWVKNRLSQSGVSIYGLNIYQKKVVFWEQSTSSFWHLCLKPIPSQSN